MARSLILQHIIDTHPRYHLLANFSNIACWLIDSSSAAHTRPFNMRCKHWHNYSCKLVTEQLLECRSRNVKLIQHIIIWYSPEGSNSFITHVLLSSNVIFVETIPTKHEIVVLNIMHLFDFRYILTSLRIPKSETNQ